VFVGVGIGFLWCSLTAISVTYLIRARGEMKERRLMEKLLKGGKANPLVAEKSDTQDDSGSLMGYDHHDKETQHAPEARVKNFKSIVRAGEDDPEGTNPRRGSAAMRTVIVTHQEKCIVLEGNTARRDITTRSGREKLNQSVSRILPPRSHRGRRQRSTPSAATSGVAWRDAVGATR
jgi:hypothetical protein